jgi:hypothetical protein
LIYVETSVMWSLSLSEAWSAESDFQSFTLLKV